MERTAQSVAARIAGNQQYRDMDFYWKRPLPRTDKRADAWQEQYALAKEYYLSHGDLLIPRDYVAGHRNLGRWIERQRAAYNGKLACGITSDCIVALNLIGMAWKLENRRPWDEWYALAETYYAENGNLRVPKDWVYQARSLGAWIGEQRKRYKAGKLSQKQVTDLEKIGIVWNARISRQPWETTFQEAKAYFDAHGNLHIPENYRAPSGMNLCRWIRMQRDIYQGSRAGTLSAEQIRKLCGIGMVWDVYGEAWENMYAAAALYFTQHGSLLVKQDYVTEAGARLGQWISIQRQDYRNKPLTPTRQDRFDRLERIGMVWYAGRKRAEAVILAPEAG